MSVQASILIIGFQLKCCHTFYSGVVTRKPVNETGIACRKPNLIDGSNLLEALRLQCQCLYSYYYYINSILAYYIYIATYNNVTSGPSSTDPVHVMTLGSNSIASARFFRTAVSLISSSPRFLTRITTSPTFCHFRRWRA